MTQPSHDQRSQPAEPTHLLGADKKTPGFGLLKIVPNLLVVVGIVAWSQDWLDSQVAQLAYGACVFLWIFFGGPRLVRQTRRRRRAR